MAFALCMTLVAIWMLVFPRFLLMGDRFGLLLGLISLWRFRAGCLMLLLRKETFQYGRLLKGSTLALEPVTVLGLSLRKLLGVMLFGLTWQSLDMRLSYGLFFRCALVTKERMCCWGFEGNTLCRFCYGGQESIDHLFFHCSFCRRIWRNLMALCLVQQSFTEWDNVVRWSCSHKGRSLQVLVCKLCLAATVCHLWRLRNDLCHGNTPRTEETLVAQIQWEVRSRLLFRQKGGRSAMATRLMQIGDCRCFVVVLCCW